MDQSSSDHAHFEDETGPWPMGWAVAAAAGVVAFVLVVGFGSGALSAGLVVGLVSFGVFAALLGQGGVERASAGPHDAPPSAGGGHH